MQKDVLHHNFWIKTLKDDDLVPRSIILRSRNPIVPLILPYDLNLLRSWPLQSLILGHISGINGKNITKFQHRVTWVEAFK